MGCPKKLVSDCLLSELGDSHDGLSMNITEIDFSPDYMMGDNQQRLAHAQITDSNFPTKYFVLLQTTSHNNLELFWTLLNLVRIVKVVDGGGGVNQGGESAQCTPLIYMYMHENIQRPHMKRKQKFWHDVVFVLNTSSALVIVTG